MNGGTGGTKSLPRPANRLTDRGIRAFLAKRQANVVGPKKLSDGGGLYLTLTPAGSTVWRLKYRISEREKLYAVGIYPSVSLERGMSDVALTHSA
jgi:Arm DNA-binding domain